MFHIVRLRRHILHGFDGNLPEGDTQIYVTHWSLGVLSAWFRF